MLKRFLSVATFIAVPALFGLTSCASLFSDYCDKRMACIGGNDKDRSACVDEIRGEEKAASDYGCSDSFDSYYECRNTTGTCNQGKFDTGCDQQNKAYDACIEAASAFR
ncbi:hypothetical protein BH09MYX1_BH09MYX1_50720 [soil metagenome]